LGASRFCLSPGLYAGSAERVDLAEVPVHINKGYGPSSIDLTKVAHRAILLPT